MQDVRAIGLKLEGSVGFSFAVDLPINLIQATFQALGTIDADQQLWYRSTKPVLSDGHFFRMRYDTWSNGEGDEPILACLTADSISCGVMGPSSNERIGMAGDGIQLG